jgi:integrase
MAAKRQANLRSSIYQDAKGTWHGWVSMGIAPDGRPDRRHREAQSRTEIVRKIRELERARDTGSVVRPGQRPTLAQWLIEWLQASRFRVRRSTLGGYEVDIRLHIVPAIGRHRLDRLRPEDVEYLYSRMLAMGMASGSVQHVRRTLSKALNDARRRNLIARNPVADAHTPRYEPPDIQPLTAGDARSILAAAMHETNGIAFVLALSLGLRRGEVLAIRWSDVDLTSGTLSVGRQLQRRRWRHGCGDPAACAADRHHTSNGCARHPARKYPAGCPRPCPETCVAHAAACPRRKDGGLVLDEPKTRRSRRVLPLPAPLVIALEMQRRAQAALRERAGSVWRDLDLVFTGRVGQPVDPNRHSEHWSEFLGRLGVRPARLHDARHTAATLLLVQGVDQRVVMDMFGWTSSAMTSRYQHVVPELRADAARRLTDVLWGPSSAAVHDATKTATETATADAASARRRRARGSRWTHKAPGNAGL